MFAIPNAPGNGSVVRAREARRPETEKVQAVTERERGVRREARGAMGAVTSSFGAWREDVQRRAREREIESNVEYYAEKEQKRREEALRAPDIPVKEFYATRTSYEESRKLAQHGPFETFVIALRFPRYTSDFDEKALELYRSGCLMCKQARSDAGCIWWQLDVNPDRTRCQDTLHAYFETKRSTGAVPPLKPLQPEQPHTRGRYGNIDDDHNKYCNEGCRGCSSCGDGLGP